MNRFINENIKPDQKATNLPKNPSNQPMTVKQWMQTSPNTLAKQLIEQILTNDTRRIFLQKTILWLNVFVAQHRMINW